MTKGNNVPPNSTPDLPDDEGSASTLKAADPEPTSDPSIQGRIPVRKSSLRPAPADYRPSARDPSTLRPMAVVRAGDVETSPPLHGDIAAPPPSQPSLASLASGAKVEPFALAEDYSVNETGDRKTPLMIPPPPDLPIDLVQKAYANQQPSGKVANFARPLNRYSQTQPQKAAAEASSGAGRARVPSSARATTRDVGQPPISDSTRTNDPRISNRRKYSLVAVALASSGIVGAVLAVMHGGHHNVAIPTTQLRAVSPALQQLDVPKLVDAPPVARERHEPVVAQAASAQSAATSPSASAPTTTRVTLELVPIDAKVNYLGRDVPGPPFEFDIAKGQRMAVEVTRLGFATAKVVIDDKKPLVHFGMLREHRSKAH